MTAIVFEKVIDGIERETRAKEKVNGYKHTIHYGIHYYKRGKVVYMVDTNFGCTLQKYDYSKAKYLDVYYDDFYKFVEIIKVRRVNE